MRGNRSSLLAAALIVTAALLSGCYSGPAMTQYVNNGNTQERLTLKTTINAKSRLISTFHGVSMGSYTVESNQSVVAQGTFSRDDKGFDFKASDGTTSFTRVNNDGTFEYLSRTWKPASDYVLREKELKGLGAVTAASASTESSSN